MTIARIFGDRRHAWAFWFGCLIVTAGVALHLPMYWMGRDMGFHLAGMAMDAGMWWGMALIVGGVALTAFGLLPAHKGEQGSLEVLAPPEDAPLTGAHWAMCALLSLALIVDIMKPASLGFVTPGMREEYGLSDAMVSILPFAALSGTVVGSFVWGWLADVYGRRASILLSSVMFVGTSICGAMPDFWWNVGMCFLMGAAAGGMLPVAYALLAEIMPTRHRGWALVLVGGIGAVGGYFAASALSAWLQPDWSWRVMWFLNLPTGLILIALSPLLPESARFLQHVGRGDEARAMLARFGSRVRTVGVAPDTESRSHLPPVDRRHLAITLALTLAALAWGLVNFGILLWLPSALVAEGRSVEAASALIARSTLIAAPTILLSVWLYSAWSTRGALALMLGVTALGLFGLLLRSMGVSVLADPVAPLAMLIVGSSGVIAIILPYTAENYPLRIRGRATGWIAGCSKLGGLLAQGLAVLAAAPPLGFAAAAIGVLTVAALGLVAAFGRETRGRDLRDLENPR
ncbi:MFS transporter [Brevundimonas sp.]|uniref:MFS transporter n=1 Tax=Brevundimonas sp. TaxID=1871086 RepID=UPI002D400ED1|nr:MFS transporter [Brevundimonas sp.]HYC73901.1 MFS transporter [Brevundimonas sp.]